MRLEVAPHEQRFGNPAQRPEGDRVANPVAHHRPALDALEGVGVVPEAIGTAQLAIDEARLGLPLLDPGRPTDRNAVESHAVADQRSGAHLDGRGVRTLKRSSGGVSASRFIASAKKSNTSPALARDQLLALEQLNASRIGPGRAVGHRLQPPTPADVPPCGWPQTLKPNSSS